VLLLISGLLLFIGIHLVPTAPPARAILVDRLGSVGYSVAFGVISGLGLAIIVLGWQAVGRGGMNPQIWSPPVWTRHISLLLMWPAMVLLVAAYVPSRIRTGIKHPMLTAIKLWALAHLLARGDLASMVLFGSLLAYAVYDRISIKRRPVGSGLGPLGQRTGGAGGDIAVVVIGTALYLLMLGIGHRYLFGVSPLPAFSFAP
jgi:uncharacterized membrane protein